MEKEFSIQHALLEVLQSLARGAIDYAPHLITALVLLLIGFLIAWIVASIIGQAMHRAHFDAVLDRIGVLQTLERIGIRQVSRRFLPGILFWFTVLVFAQSAATIAGMAAIAAAITSFFAFVPNLLSAALVVLLGNVLAQFLGRAVTTYARDSGLAFARSLGSAVTSFVLGVVGIIALGQLQVDTRILNILTIVLFSGLSLGLALTFGLGTRETTRNMVAGFYARRLFGAGQDVEMAGERGMLRTIAATQTVLELKGQTVAIPNSTFLEQTVRRHEAEGVEA